MIFFPWFFWVVVVFSPRHYQVEWTGISGESENTNKQTNKNREKGNSKTFPAPNFTPAWSARRRTREGSWRGVSAVLIGRSMWEGGGGSRATFAPPSDGSHLRVATHTLSPLLPHCASPLTHFSSSILSVRRSLIPLSRLYRPGSSWQNHSNLSFFLTSPFACYSPERSQSRQSSVGAFLVSPAFTCFVLNACLIFLFNLLPDDISTRNEKSQTRTPVSCGD